MYVAKEEGAEASITLHMNVGNKRIYHKTMHRVILLNQTPQRSSLIQKANFQISQM